MIGTAEEELIIWMQTIGTETLEDILARGENKGEPQWYTQTMTEEVQKRKSLRFRCSDCEEEKLDVQQRFLETDSVEGSVILDLCDTCWEKRL